MFTQRLRLLGRERVGVVTAGLLRIDGLLAAVEAGLRRVGRLRGVLVPDITISVSRSPWASLLDISLASQNKKQHCALTLLRSA